MLTFDVDGGAGGRSDGILPLSSFVKIMAARDCRRKAWKLLDGHESIEWEVPPSPRGW